MEWKDARKFDGGGNGSYQETEEPRGYCITFSVDAEDRATFIASFRDKAFASFRVDPRNKAMSKNAARAMRVACGMHNEST